MFNMIATLLKALFPKRERADDQLFRESWQSAPYSRSVAADGHTILMVLSETIFDLWLRTALVNEPPEQMLHAFTLGVRITLSDPGLGRAIQEASLLPKYKQGRDSAIMDQTAAALRDAMEDRGRGVG